MYFTYLIHHIKIFLLVCLLQVSVIEAAAKGTGLWITSVQKGQPASWITLSNGSVWRYDNPSGFQQAWFIGDQVELRPTKSMALWLLFNQSYSSNIPVTLEKLGSNLPRLVDIADLGLTLQLSDGTMWSVDWWDAILKQTRFWQIGDTLLVTPYQEGAITRYLIADPNREMIYVHAVPFGSSTGQLLEEQSEFKIGKPRGG